MATEGPFLFLEGRGGGNLGNLKKSSKNCWKKTVTGELEDKKTDGLSIMRSI